MGGASSTVFQTLVIHFNTLQVEDFLCTPAGDCENPNSNLVTGIRSEFINTSVRIFPNPTSGVLHVRVLGPIDQLQVIDQLGKIWHNSKPASNSVSAELGSLPSGLYVVALFTGGNVSYQRILKR